MLLQQLAKLLPSFVEQLLVFLFYHKTAGN